VNFASVSDPEEHSASPTNVAVDVLCIVFPVTCSICGESHGVALDPRLIAAALLNDRPIRLVSACHSAVAFALPAELERLRRCLYGLWVNCD